MYIHAWNHNFHQLNDGRPRILPLKMFPCDSSVGCARIYLYTESPRFRFTTITPVEERKSFTSSLSVHNHSGKSLSIYDNLRVNIAISIWENCPSEHKCPINIGAMNIPEILLKADPMFVFTSSKTKIWGRLELTSVVLIYAQNATTS